MEFNKLVESLVAYGNIKEDLVCDRLSQAYLFLCSDRLTSKILLSRIATMLVCDHESACDACGNCAKMNAGTHPDVLIYPKGKGFSVEDSADIYDKVQVKPILNKRKVFVINDIDISTEQAQNKMLKIIEEPPNNVIFLFSAKNINKVLKTIQSRVKKIYVDKINKNLLKNIINVPENIKEIAIINGDGYLGKTLEIAENDAFIKIYKNIQKLILELKNSVQIPEFSASLCISKDVFEKSLEILSGFYRDILMLKLNKENLIINYNIINDPLNFEDYSVKALIEILKRLNYCKQKLESNVNLTTLADAVLLEILEVKFLCK